MLEWIKRRLADREARRAKTDAVAAGEMLGREQLTFINQSINEWIADRIEPTGPRMLAVYKTLASQALSDDDPLGASEIAYHVFADAIRNACVDFAGARFESELPRVAEAMDALDRMAAEHMNGVTLKDGKLEQLREILDDWRLDVLLEGVVIGRQLVAVLGEEASAKFNEAATAHFSDLMAESIVRDSESRSPLFRRHRPSA